MLIIRIFIIKISKIKLRKSSFNAAKIIHYFNDVQIFVFLFFAMAKELIVALIMLPS